MVLIDSIKWAQKSCASFACLVVEASMMTHHFLRVLSSVKHAVPTDMLTHRMKDFLGCPAKGL